MPWEKIMQQGPEAALALSIWHVQLAVVSSWLVLHLYSLLVSAAFWVQCIFFSSFPARNPSLEKGQKP
jgi:hypothetical protein